MGAWLTEHFLQKGAEVYVLSHTLGRERPWPCKYLEVDLSARGEVLSVLRGITVDTCIHTASVNETFIEDYPRKALCVNAYGTRNLIEALLPSQIQKFIYFSTFHVYGAASGIIDEQTVPEPTNDYALTHHFAELYLKQFYKTQRFPYTAIRLTNGYGAPKTVQTSKWYLALNDMARMAWEKKEIVLRSNGEARRDFIWMGDVCEITDQLLMAGNTIGEVFNAGAEKTWRIIEIAEIVRSAYYKRYGKTIAIKVNEQDTSRPDLLEVKCGKLKSVIQYTLHERFAEEAAKIFDLLEKAPHE